MKFQDDILDNVDRVIKHKSSKFYNELYTQPKDTRKKIIKELHLNYCNSILEFVQALDKDIHIVGIGTLKIKPSRKQYLDLLHSGVDKEEAIKIVKDSYRELNGKKKAIL
jgi:hypothetical protein